MGEGGSRRASTRSMTTMMRLVSLVFIVVFEDARPCGSRSFPFGRELLQGQHVLVKCARVRVKKRHGDRRQVDPRFDIDDAHDPRKLLQLLGEELDLDARSPRPIHAREHVDVDARDLKGLNDDDVALRPRREMVRGPLAFQPGSPSEWEPGLVNGRVASLEAGTWRKGLLTLAANEPTDRSIPDRPDDDGRRALLWEDDEGLAIDVDEHSYFLHRCQGVLV